MKILIVLFLMMFCVNAYAAVVPTSVSGGTVDFTSNSPAASSSSGTTGQTVTFNSVTKYLYFRNESINTDCYVNIECKSTDNYTGTLAVYTVKVPYGGGASPNTVELDFATKRLSFWSPDGSGEITFIVTGEAGDL